MALEAIRDQPRVVDLLRRALASGRVAHAYAFLGAPGSGRTTAARAFGAALLCEHGGCGACRGCTLAAAGRHPDLHVIVPTPPEKNPRGPLAVRIDDIRALEHAAALAPVMAPRKVFVLEDADRMTGETPQAFLKTLEEPPPRTVMILVLQRARAVPATVLSRCQIVRFAPPPAVAAPERAEAFEALLEVRGKGADALFRRSQAFDRDRERAERFVDGCWLLCRDLLLAKAGAPTRLLVRPEQAEVLAREAGDWSQDALLAGIAACREARAALAVNVTPRLTLEIVLSRLASRAA